MNIKNYLNKIGKGIVSIEINAKKYDYDLVYKLQQNLRAFKSELTIREKKAHGEQLEYLERCLKNAQIIIADVETQQSARIAVFENILNDLK